MLCWTRKVQVNILLLTLDWQKCRLSGVQDCEAGMSSFNADRSKLIEQGY